MSSSWTKQPYLYLLLGIVIFAVGSEADNKNWEVQSGDFVVEVTGNQNQPKYFFWLEGQKNKSFVMFHKLYEATLNNGSVTPAGHGTMVSLPSLSWVFTKPILTTGTCYKTEYQQTTCKNCSLQTKNATKGCAVCQTLSLSKECSCVDQTNNVFCNCSVTSPFECKETEFNITNSANSKEDESWKSIQFRSHLVNLTTNSHLKIDIEVDGYRFKYNNTVLVIEVSLDLGSGTVLTDHRSFVRVGDSYFSSQQWAVIEPGASNVSVSLQYKGNVIQLIYQHYPSGSNLIHDPTIGFVTEHDDPFPKSDSSSSSSSTDSSSDHSGSSSHKFPWWGIALVCVAVVAVVAIGIAVVFRRKTSTYQEI